MRAIVFRTVRLAALAALVVGTTTAPAWAQTLTFVFVGPAATLSANFPEADVKGGYGDGYRGVIITPANLATFRKLAGDKMKATFDALQPGTPLRAKVDRMMKLSHSLVLDVQVHLVDDRTGINAADTIYVPKLNDATKLTYVWPAAWNTPVAGPPKGHQGTIGIGETTAALHEKSMGSWAGWESVVLHETLHTQFVGQKTKWGAITATYGMDYAHQFSEILGAQDLTFEEGLGTFYGYTHYHPQGLGATNDFFGRTDDRYLTEDASIPASWIDLRKVASSTEQRPIPQRVKDRQPDRTTYTRYKFKWMNVPGKYLLFNEWTSCAFHVYFWRYANNDPDQAFRMIDENSGWMWGELKRRYPAWAANNLALQLEKFAATPEGQAKKTAGTLTSSMFPIALLDLITHFGMTDDELQTEFKRQQAVWVGPSKALTEYWNHRAAIKQLVDADLKASPMRFEQAVKAVNTYFQKPNTILVP